MKLSLNWLRDYVELPEDIDFQQLAHDLTMRTVEVEDIIDPAAALEGSVAGRIVELAAHPDADLLRVCQVDTGEEGLRQIVCGGTNLAVDQWVVVALPGAKVRWHGEGEPVAIRSTKLRGVRSEGMICAASELGLEALFPAEDEAIIMDLEGFDVAPGRPLAEVLGLAGEAVLEIDNKSMTHRPDLWGHYGMARELAAIYDLPLRDWPRFEAEAPAEMPVRIEAPEACRRYIGAVYEGLDVRPAPFWMRQRLWLVEQRPINGLVDLTNYVMMATGQPTHGFDRTHVEGGIVVRHAHEGEALTLLDGTELTLSTSDLAICDETEALALAGIMGGARDSILPETTAMVLEIANFEARGVRSTAMRLGLRTEASTRFEKAIDTQRCDLALALSQQLIEQLYPDARLVSLHDCAHAETAPSAVELRYDYLERRLGQAVSGEEVRRLLEPLGFVVEDRGERLAVTAPTWRSTGDIELPADILEEVARMIGYENFPYQAPRYSATKAIHQPQIQLTRRVAEYFAAQGACYEVITYPWTSDALLEACEEDASDWPRLAHPPAPDQARLRGSLVPGLLGAVAANLRYEEAPRIFELAQVYGPGWQTPAHSGERLPVQRRELAVALVMPLAQPGTPLGSRFAEALLREARGLVEALPRLVQCVALRFDQQGDKPGWADRSAWLTVHAQAAEDAPAIGHVGLVSLVTMNAAEIERSVVAVIQLDVDALEPLPSRSNQFAALPRYPEVEADLSLLVAEDVSWAAIEAIVAPQVRRVIFVEEYRGRQVPAGKKSLLLRYWLGSDEGTLTAEEIEARSQRIIAKLNKQLGAELRA